MTTRCLVIGLLWALLDHHGDRDADDLPETYRGKMRAMYAAVETYTGAEVASCEAARLRGWVWVARVLPALLWVVWWAGRLREVRRMQE